MTAIGDRLYLFLAESVMELDALECKKTAGAPWPFSAWPAQSAVVVGESVVAFGVAGGTLHSAVLPAVKDPLGGNWRYREVPVDGQGRCVQVRAVVAGGKPWLFWSVKDPSRNVEALWASELGDGKPAAAIKLDDLTGRAEFSVVAFDGEPMVVYAGLPVHLEDPSFLSVRKHLGDRWLPVEYAREVVNPYGEQTRSLSAVVVGTKVQMFVGTDSRILETTYNGKHWGPPRAALSDPQTDFLLENTRVIIIVFAVALAISIASIARSRYLPRRAIINDIEYPFAPWWRRGAAYVFDFIIVFFAVRGIHSLSGRVPTAATWPTAMFVFELFYFTMCEARSGTTLGKRLFGIVVVSRNGGYPSFRQAMMRNLPRALMDSLFMPLGAFVGLITILNTKSSQRLGDLTAGTHVVREHQQK